MIFWILFRCFDRFVVDKHRSNLEINSSSWSMFSRSFFDLIIEFSWMFWSISILLISNRVFRSRKRDLKSSIHNFFLIETNRHVEKFLNSFKLLFCLLLHVSDSSRTFSNLFFLAKQFIFKKRNRFQRTTFKVKTPQPSAANNVGHAVFILKQKNGWPKYSCLRWILGILF